MGAMEVTYLGALGAGLLSFVSPCVLPLVPAYLCFLGGASLNQLTGEDGVDPALAKRVFIAALAFVFGFATVFVALGATATVASKIIAQNMEILSRIAGTVIVIFGLHFMGLFRIGFLNFEARFHTKTAPTGLAGSYLLGLAFAFGWTPCVGPVLATILMVAATGEDAWYGASLLGMYAAGIGVPFLAAALAVRPFMAFMARFRRHLRTVELAVGGLLILTGVLIFTGSLADVAQWLLETFPDLGRIG